MDYVWLFDPHEPNPKQKNFYPTKGSFYFQLAIEFVITNVSPQTLFIHYLGTTSLAFVR